MLGMRISVSRKRARQGRALGTPAWALCAVGALITSVASAETVEIFSAGSLREVVNELAKDAGTKFNVEVKATFGGSGLLRERIEKGEKPDLFLSADVGSPSKLAAEGRALVPAIAFARNRMCIVSRRSLGLTPANLLKRLLAQDVRIKTPTPVADPAGDYAWAIFDRIEALHPGSGAALKDKARALMDVRAGAAVPGQSAGAALFASKQVDLSITYCSGVPNLEKELPELTSMDVPPALDPHPIDGMAILSAKPEAMRLALYLVSQRGQEIIAAAGLVPIGQQTLQGPAAPSPAARQ